MNRRVRFNITIIVIVLVFLTTFVTQVVAMQLQRGSRGNSVVILQNDLKELGFFSANSTGYYGSITEKSVKSFQTKNGLYTDGIAGPKTLDSINSLLHNITSSQTAINTTLMFGARSNDVKRLQLDLASLGYLNANATGYYGNLTKTAVTKVQADNSLAVDGIAGKDTFEIIHRLKSRTVTASRSHKERQNYLVAWAEADRLFPRNAIAVVTDVETGLRFKVKRTYGTNHADCEPLTAEDAAIMKKAAGGDWSWARRAIIVDVNGTKIAASMNSMPHAGLDNYKEGSMISSRSAGYGYGYNYDDVKGNNFNGHICIHFLNSRTHGTNSLDSKHQAMVKTATEWAKASY